MQINWKIIYPHIIAILSFIVITSAYFSPQFQGKVLIQPDIEQYKNMTEEARTWEEKTGHYPLWTNSMFGGMPTFQMGMKNNSNLTRYVASAFALTFNRPIGYFLTGMICMYILMLTLGVRPWVAAISAIGFSFMTYNFILYEAGHTSKLRVFNLFPLVTAGLILTFRQKYLIGGSIFALAMAMSIWANHVQMVYYLGIVLLVYVIFEAIQHIRTNRIIDFLKVSGVLLFALGLAVGTSAVQLIATQILVEDTMRGGAVLEEVDKGNQENVNEDGLAWSYATYHSHGIKDLATYIIPGAAGGGSMDNAEWSDDLKKDRGWSQVLAAYGGRAPLYHGDLPFTSGPVYLGAVLLFFFVLSMFNTIGHLRWWALTATILTLCISLGDNFSILNRALFDYFPLFSKFRAHNSIATITPLMTTMMAGLALHNWLKSEESMEMVKKKLLPALGVSIGLVIIAYLISSSGGFTAEGDARFTQQGLSGDAIERARASLLNSDTMRAIFLVLAAALTLFLYSKKMINSVITLAIITTLVVGDMWSIGQRYLNKDTFKSKRVAVNATNPRPVDEEILKDHTLYYRVHDQSINSFNSATTSRFHKTIGGYNPAKLQRYQDLIERHISTGNMKVFNMLNTKYFITPEKEVKVNSGAMGNAWFVTNVQEVQSNNEEIDALSNFEPQNTVIIHKEYIKELSQQNYSGMGTITLTDYSPEELIYTSENPGKGLAVFSEIWFGPNKGWKAYIDGNEVPILRANYVLRAIEIPAGKHEIVMKFYPTYVYNNATLETICSILIFACCIFAGYREVKKRWS